MYCIYIYIPADLICCCQLQMKKATQPTGLSFDRWVLHAYICVGFSVLCGGLSLCYV